MSSKSKILTQLDELEESTLRLLNAIRELKTNAASMSIPANLFDSKNLTDTQLSILKALSGRTEYIQKKGQQRTAVGAEKTNS